MRLSCFLTLLLCIFCSLLLFCLLMHLLWYCHVQPLWLWTNANWQKLTKRTLLLDFSMNTEQKKPSARSAGAPPSRTCTWTLSPQFLIVIIKGAPRPETHPEVARLAPAAVPAAEPSCGVEIYEGRRALIIFWGVYNNILVGCRCALLRFLWLFWFSS